MAGNSEHGVTCLHRDGWGVFGRKAYTDQYVVRATLDLERAGRSDGHRPSADFNGPHWRVSATMFFWERCSRSKRFTGEARRSLAPRFG